MPRLKELMVRSAGKFKIKRKKDSEASPTSTSTNVTGSNSTPTVFRGSKCTITENTQSPSGITTSTGRSKVPKPPAKISSTTGSAGTQVHPARVVSRDNTPSKGVFSNIHIPKLKPSPASKKELYEACTLGTKSLIESLLSRGVVPALATPDYLHCMWSITDSHRQDEDKKDMLAPILTKARKEEFFDSIAWQMKRIWPYLTLNEFTDICKTLTPETLNHTLSWAINSADHTNHVQTLLEAGADPNGSSGGELFLCASIRLSNTPAFSLLLTHGASPNHPTTRTPPLLLATSTANLPFATHLLTSGAHPNVLGPIGTETLAPIHIAARYPTPALLHVLLNRGADPNLPDGVAKTPLHHAILSSQSTNITTLLDAGADPARPDSDARTPLHHAAKLPSPCVRALLHAHLDLDVPDALGNTPLHLAAWANNVPVLELLLQAGAKPTPRNKAGYMPVDLAGSGGHREAFNALRRRVGLPAVRGSCYPSSGMGDWGVAGRFARDVERPAGREGTWPEVWMGEGRGWVGPSVGSYWD